jgi:hypothetical protein
MMDIFDILTKMNHLSKQIEPAWPRWIILGENRSLASLGQDVKDAKDKHVVLLMRVKTQKLGRGIE